MAETKPKPITAELKRLPVGGEARFPMEQRSSVQSIISKLKYDLMRSNWNCETDTDTDNFLFIVRRTS